MHACIYLPCVCVCGLQIRFIDNTDPAGIDHQIAQLGPELSSTLVVVVSKVCVLFDRCQDFFKHQLIET